MNYNKHSSLVSTYSIILLAIISVSIIWYFATTNFATHSDVFWYGSEATTNRIAKRLKNLINEKKLVID